MHYLKADYTEVWISTPMVPLIQFSDRVQSISSTGLDRVFTEVPAALAAQLNHFDEIVTWYGTNRPEFRHALQAFHSNCIFLQALPGPEWQNHAIDFFVQQVGAPLGSTPQIQVEATDRRLTLTIHPFSGSPRKNWPLEKFRQLATRFSSEWIAGPEEILPDANRFESLLDLAQWLKGSSAYIGNDSGISHLAAAIGVPSLVLFGPTNQAVWAPRGEHVSIVHYHPLSDLAVEAVAQKAANLLPG